MTLASYISSASAVDTGEDMDVKSRMKTFIIDELMHGNNKVVLGDEESLLERGILDSLGLLKVLTFLEQEYHVVFKDEEIIPENFESINAIVSFVEKRRNGGNSD